jgi:hypothetical protein
MMGGFVGLGSVLGSARLSPNEMFESPLDFIREPLDPSPDPECKGEEVKPYLPTPARSISVCIR